MADPEAEIIWGSAFDPRLEGRIRVSVVATGLDRAARAVADQALEEQAPKPPTFLVPAASVPTPARTVPASDLYPVPTRVRAPEAPLPPAMSIEEMLAPVEAPDVQPEVEQTPPESALNDEQVVTAGLLPEAPAEVQPHQRERVRGPSLFERMAMAARSAVIRRESDRAAGPTPRHGPVFLDRRNAA